MNRMLAPLVELQFLVEQIDRNSMNMDLPGLVLDFRAIDLNIMAYQFAHMNRFLVDMAMFFPLECSKMTKIRTKRHQVVATTIP